LTITPSSSNTTTESACDSYTWAENGQTYTQSGTYSSVSGCDTEILVLTITPSGTNTTTISACDQYVWSVNGQTYTQSGTYSSVNGCSTEILVLTINGGGGIVSPPGTISGPTSFCNPQGVVATYSIAAVSGATSYVWTVPTGTVIVSGQGTTSINVTWPNSVIQNGVFGDVCVAATTTCGTSDPSCLTIDVQVSKPVTPPSISGPTRACPGDTLTYSVGFLARASFWNWTVPTGASIISGAGTQVIQVAFGNTFTTGVIEVFASNACGNGNARTRTVLPNTLTAPGAISGQLTGLCNAAGVTYTCGSVTGASSYNWTVPAGASIVSGQGTTTIVVNYGSLTTGSVSVAAVNGCGDGTLRTATVTGAPGQPGVINGPSAICVLQNANYDVATVAGAASYTWAIPSGFQIIAGQGTKTLTVKAGSNPASGLTISVRAVNSCGTSPIRARNGISVTNCARTESSAFMDINAYPNPVSDLLNVTFSSDKNQDVLVNVLDAAGRLVMTENRNADEGSNKFEFSVKGLSSGIYSLQFRTADAVETIRIIVE